MIWTATRIRIGREIMGHTNVAHLRMQEAVDDLAVHDGAATNAGADREVDEIGDSSPRAPTGLAGSRGVHIGVESDWDLKRSPHSARKIVLLPPGLRS